MSLGMEYPAYHIYVHKHDVWELQVKSVFHLDFSQVRAMAKDILYGNDENDTVRIYGAFNGVQSFVEEISRKENHQGETIPDIYDELMSLCKGHVRYPHDTVKIRGFPISYNDVKLLAKRIKKAYEREMKDDMQSKEKQLSPLR